MRRADDDVVWRHSNSISPPNPPTRSSHMSSLELLQAIGAPTISFVESKTVIGGGRKEENISQGDNIVVANEDKSESSYDRLGFIHGHELFPMYKVDDLMEWKSMKPIGPGLYNHGNTCYINSTLQCLLYIPVLAQHLAQERDEYVALGGIELKEGRERVSFDALALISKLASHIHGDAQFVRPKENGKNRKAAVAPTEIIRNIRYLGKQFVPGRQEDAHEFLRQLLDKMAEAYLFRRSIKSNAPNRLGETTPIHRIFAGYLRSRVTCLSCGFKSDSFDMAMDLCLGMSKKVNSVEHALQRFLSAETLSKNNRWKCSRCHKVVSAKKQFTIHVAPRVLVIQLKRFKYGRVGKKICHRLHYPLALRIPTSGGEGHVKYDLCGVVVHSGQSIVMGHYFAYVRGANRLWYLMDDDMVRQARAPDVLNQEAYMLFYYRNDHRLYDVPSSQPAAAAMPQLQQVEAKLPVHETLLQPLSSTAEENVEMEDIEDDHELLKQLGLRVQRAAAKRAELINMQYTHRISEGRNNVRGKRWTWVKKSILERFTYPGRGRWKWMCSVGGLKVSPSRKREKTSIISNNNTLKLQKRDLNDDSTPFSHDGYSDTFTSNGVEGGNIQGIIVNEVVDDDNTCIKRKRENEEEVVPGALPAFGNPIDSSIILGTTIHGSMNGQLGGKLDPNPNQEELGLVTMTTVDVDKGLNRTSTSVSNTGGVMEDLGGWEGLDGEEGAKLQRDRTLQAEINTYIQNEESCFNRKHQLDAWDMALDKGKAKKVKATQEPIAENTNKIFQRAQYKKQQLSAQKPKGSHINTSQHIKR